MNTPIWRTIELRWLDTTEGDETWLEFRETVSRLLMALPQATGADIPRGGGTAELRAFPGSRPS